MGCTQSHELGSFESASSPPGVRMRQKTVDEQAEVELLRTAIVPIQTKDGSLEYETLEYWAKPKPGAVYASAPGPPPYPPRRADPRAHLFVDSEPFFTLSHDMVRRAMQWAGHPAPSHVWVRLMDSGVEGNVSADALFLVHNKLRSPFHIHPGTETQRALLKELARLWREKITSKGAVGTHHPGDIVIQAIARGATPAVTLAGFDWSAHRCDTPGRRRLWLEHFVNQGFEGLNLTLAPRPSDSPAASEISRPTTLTSRSSVASTSHTAPEATASRRSVSGPGLPALSFVDPNSGELVPRTQRWLESIEPTLSRMLYDILSWPPTKGRVHRLYIWLVHLRGRGSTVCVELKDASRTMIAESTSPSHPDPKMLQFKVAAHWTNICRTGAPGVDHPVFMRLVGIPRGSGICSELAAFGVWQESALPPHACALIERWYAARQGDAAPPEGTRNPPRQHPPSLPASPPLSHPPMLGRAVDFATNFRPVAQRMIALAQEWPPRGTQIREIRMIFATDRARGLAGYTLITGGADEALDKRPSAADDNPYVLQEKVLQLLAEYCRTAHGEVPAAIVVQIHPSVPGVDIRSMWEEGEEARRGMGVTLHYLWHLFGEWSGHAATLPWPERCG